MMHVNKNANDKNNRQATLRFHVLWVHSNGHQSVKMDRKITTDILLDG